MKRSTYAGVVDTGPIPGETPAQKIADLKSAYLEQLAAVDNIADDRMARTLLAMVEATVRTNYFCDIPSPDPYIVLKFESAKIEKTGDQTGKMTGNLTMHGETHPITLDVTYNKGGKHLSGKYSVDGFTAKGMLKRSDFGMKAFTPAIGDEVEFVVQFEAKRPNDPS